MQLFILQMQEVGFLFNGRSESYSLSEEVIDLLIYSKIAASHDEFFSSVDEFLKFMNFNQFQRTPEVLNLFDNV